MRDFVYVLTFLHPDVYWVFCRPTLPNVKLNINVYIVYITFEPQRPTLGSIITSRYERSSLDYLTAILRLYSDLNCSLWDTTFPAYLCYIFFDKDRLMYCFPQFTPLLA